MASTVTLAVIFDRRVEIANVGDSRACHRRAPQLTQVTRDHSDGAALVERGRSRVSEGATYAKVNTSLKALGTDQTVTVGPFSRRVEPGDKLLLCSYGFWKVFPDRAGLAR